MNLQAEVEREGTGLKQRSTLNERRLAERVAAEQRGDWNAAATIDERIEEIEGAKASRTS